MSCGNSILEAYAAIDAFVGTDADYSKQLIGAKCRGLMFGYDARWRDAGFTTLETEKVYRSNLWNPESGRSSRSFEVAGKVDVDAIHAGKRIIIDHKTTSEDISDPNSPYWRQLVVEAQASHYMFLEWLNGQKVDSALWDVVRKPGISPKAISKAEVERVIITRNYCGRQLSETSILSVQKDSRETLEMYEARLAHDCSTERPQWYFQRRPVVRLDSELHEHGLELWADGQEILHARLSKRWGKNSGACLLYRSPCKFLGICSNHDDPESGEWKRKTFVHDELIGIEGDGRNILTNSRISLFKTCRKKHYFQYELGIEKFDEEEREAIFFGNCWHAAQQAWWNFFKAAPKEQLDGDTNSGSAGSDLATTCKN